MTNIPFNKFYKKFNSLSLILIIISLLLLLFKGLNFGVDFKGGTLIEIRTEKNSNNISLIRDSFKENSPNSVCKTCIDNTVDHISN